MVGRIAKNLCYHGLLPFLIVLMVIVIINTQLRAGTVSNDPTLTGLDYSIHTWAPGFSGSCFNVIPFHFVLKISHCLRISSVSTAINRNLKCSFM